MTFPLGSFRAEGRLRRTSSAGVAGRGIDDFLGIDPLEIGRGCADAGLAVLAPLSDSSPDGRVKETLQSTHEPRGWDSPARHLPVDEKWPGSTGPSALKIGGRNGQRSISAPNRAKSDTSTAPPGFCFFE
jgi:hypothetical protein